MQLILSIVVPTLNSESTLGNTLISVRSQTYDQNLVEIIVVDGGSSDATVEIAKQNGCVILKNHKVQQEYAKHQGMLHAKGKYIMFLDSDEVLETKFDLSTRMAIFQKDNRVKILFSGGYRPPQNSSFANQYVSLFGDPFSYYMYGISPFADFFLGDYKSKYKNFDKHKDYVLFRFNDKSILPLIDLCAGATIDIDYLKEKLNNIINDPILIPQIPYIMMRKSKSIAILTKHGIIHNSVDSLKKFLNKLQWRIVVNIHFIDHPGTGFSNRDIYQPLTFNLKKYLFVPFVLTLIGPLSVCAYFLIVRKKKAALLHPLLSLYVALYICHHYLLKIVGIKPSLFIYGKISK